MMNLAFPSTYMKNIVVRVKDIVANLRIYCLIKILLRLPKTCLVDSRNTQLIHLNEGLATFLNRTVEGFPKVN